MAKLCQKVKSKDKKEVILMIFICQKPFGCHYCIAKKIQG
jgi:hypothetical protein